MHSLPFYISGTIRKWLNENIHYNYQTFRLSSSLITMSITKSPKNSESKGNGEQEEWSKNDLHSNICH